jgi:hypothetical protein
VQAAEQQLLAQAEARGEKLAVLDIPLLFETGALTNGWMPSWWCRRLPRSNARAYWHARE